MVTVLLCLSLAPVLAQQVLRRSIPASGDGSVAVRPDAARVTVSVVNQAATGAEAASQNATVATAVIEAIRRLLGANADVKTVSYNLTPVYSNPRNGSAAQIVGFMALNSVEAIAADPNLAGRVIDTAVAAGATRIEGIRLFLQDDDASRAQALRLASQRARVKADAIALGLGVRLGQMLYAQEGVSSLPPAGSDRIGGALTTVPTPVEVGTLEVRATVTVDIEIAP
jgi:uncharacterized protein YggE